MAMDIKLIALIASEIKLSEPVAEYIFQGVSVKVDLNQGVVTVPDEQRVGATLITYSEDIRRFYRAPVEAALVMKMQMELLQGIASIQDTELQEFLNQRKPNYLTPTPDEVQSDLQALVRWANPPTLNMFAFFQPAPHRQSPVKEALREAFKGHDLNDLKSLTQLQTILETIESSLDQSTLRLGG